MAIKGSLKLNMKRDDARTLMLKMDARLTFAGRERYAGFKLEGERKLRHIEVTHKLANAELNRERKTIQRRSEFYRALIENNKERRQKRETAWCEEEEKEWDRQARAARRRRRLPKIEPRRNHEAEAINSVRRELKRGFANKMTHEMHMNRSLNELNDSIVRHQMFEKRNERIKLSPITGAETEKDKPESNKVLDKPKPTLVPIVFDEGSGKLTKAAHKVLPDIPVDRKEEQPSRPAVAPPTDTGRSFYVNTSTEQQHPAGGNLPEISALSMLQKMRRKGVHAINPADSKEGDAASTSTKGPNDTDPSSQKTKNRRTSLLSTGPQQKIPLRFYEAENNPFLKGFKLPDINRSSALVDADKADEMFEWLGFESKEQFETLRMEAMGPEEGDACSEASSVEDNQGDEKT